MGLDTMYHACLQKGNGTHTTDGKILYIFEVFLIERFNLTFGLIDLWTAGQSTNETVIFKCHTFSTAIPSGSYISLRLRLCLRLRLHLHPSCSLSHTTIHVPFLSGVDRRLMTEMCTREQTLPFPNNKKTKKNKTKTKQKQTIPTPIRYTGGWETDKEGRARAKAAAEWIHSDEFRVEVGDSMVFLVMYVRVRLPSLTKIPQYNFNFFSGLFPDICGKRRREKFHCGIYFDGDVEYTNMLLLH